MSNGEQLQNPNVPVFTGVSGKIFQLLATVYGPYIFGVLSLLVVWFSIVEPQLSRQAVDYEKNEKLVETMRSVAATMEGVSRSLERTATTLDAVVTRANP